MMMNDDQIIQNIEEDESRIPPAVLIVDDDPLVHQMIEPVLTGQGFEVTNACNGLEALHHCRLCRPDAIVLDINMPEMDGYTFLKRLKSDATTPAPSIPPVIVLTSREDMRDIFAEEGINDYLVKPVDPDVLAKKVTAHITRPIKTVLLVEDEDDLRHMIQRRLEKNGYRVISARDGLEAVQLLQRHKPDCSVLDVMLPKMSGFHVCRMIKFNRRLQDCAVVLLTALAGDDVAYTSQSVKADACLHKPFDPPLLLNTLKSLLWD